MKKIDKQKIPYIVCVCVLVLGVLLFLFNADNLENNSFFNKYSVINNVTKMKGNYGIAGYSFDKGTYGMYVDIYKDRAISGNIAIIGIGLSIVSLITMIVYYLIQLKSGVIKQTELLGDLTKNSNYNVSASNIEENNFQANRRSMFCTNCGKELMFDTNYCPNCGQAVIHR